MAAQNMLAQEAEISTVPYLWTAMFGKSLRYAGNCSLRRTDDAGPGARRGGAKVLAECTGGAWSLGGATTPIGSSKELDGGKARDYLKRKRNLGLKRGTG